MNNFASQRIIVHERAGTAVCLEAGPPPVRACRKQYQQAKCLLFVPFLVATGFFLIPKATPGGQTDGLAHYIVFSIDTNQVIRPKKHQVVALSAPLVSKSEAALQAALQAAPRDVTRILVRVVNHNGETIHQDVVEVPRWLRGEFHVFDTRRSRADGTLDPLEESAFVVRIPVGGTILYLRPGLTGSEIPFNLEALATDTTLPLAAFTPSLELLSTTISGSPGNRVDLLVMCDGYTAAQAAQFESHASQVIAGFFNLTPYSEYRNYVNTYTLFTASSQSGADHPPYVAGCSPTRPPTCCGDPAMLDDPLRGTFVNTAFDGSYCTNNTHRLLTVDDNKVLAAAAAMPDWDRIIVIVNDSTYGGSGGTHSVISTHSAAIQIAQHEYGHSFTGLADEYEAPNPGYPACSDISSPPLCEPNVTNQVSRPLIKWVPWILPQTPVPTPNSDPAYATVVGLFEGARYLSAGMYRSRQNFCIMRDSTLPFCEICRQAYVLRLYDRGWGNPAEGIDNIEPGFENPLPGQLFAPFPGSVTFSVSLLQPVGGPPLAITWLVDGTPVPGANSNVFTYTPASAGTATIEVRTNDTTPFVHPAMAGQLLDSTRVWNVTFAAPSPPTATSFFKLPLCRAVDTRNPPGDYGGPALAANSTRNFGMAGRCGIPATAKAVSLNIVVTQPTAQGDLRFYPGNTLLPLVSTINYQPGQTLANNTIVRLSPGGNGSISVRTVQASGTTHLLIDVNGFFE